MRRDAFIEAWPELDPAPSVNLQTGIRAGPADDLFVTSEEGGHPVIKLLLSGCVYLVALVAFVVLNFLSPDSVRRLTDSILVPAVATIAVVGWLVWVVRTRRDRAKKVGERSPESSLPIHSGVTPARPAGLVIAICIVNTGLKYKEARRRR